MRIAFIGFGEAARAFIEGIKETGAHRFSAYDILSGPDFDAAASSLGVDLADTAENCVQNADYIFSAVTASSSFEAARAAIPALRQGQVFIDINSVSPGRKIETAAAVRAAHATYVDMAVMAPVRPARQTSPTLLAGEVDGVLPVLQSLGFKSEIVSDTVGDAAAIKMVRSMFVKGYEALCAETLLAARASGIQDRILKSISGSYPGLNWPEGAAYHIERIATHGIRRADEMEESAKTIDALGLNGNIALETSRIHRRIGELGVKVAPDAPLDEILAALEAAMTTRQT